MEKFIGEIILESLDNSLELKEFSSFLIKQRIVDMPNEPENVWHVNRYEMPVDKVKELLSRLERNFVNGGWYIHFFSKEGRDLYVTLKDRTFLISKIKDDTWNEMIEYGEKVGCERRWTEKIPIHFTE